MHHNTILTKPTVCTLDFQDCAQSIIASFKAMLGITGIAVQAAGSDTPPWSWASYFAFLCFCFPCHCLPVLSA